VATEARKKEVLKALYDGVVDFDEDKVVEFAKVALDEDVDAYEAIMDGLAAGMEHVGELYANQEYFVPEVLMCSDALYAGLDILKPHVSGKEAHVKGQVVIGTVEGDVHDIGKNLVKMMFDVAGFTVHDLGRDVKLEKFVEEQLKTDSEIVALSALMTTSMLAMPKVIEMIKARNPKALIMVGGAPISQEVADNYGADGYAKNAANAVQEAIQMIARLRELGKA
jgi:corrinoid protein of di/trimethylamine methyltransferase